MKIKFITTNGESVGENFMTASFITRVGRLDGNLTISNLFLCEMSVNSKTTDIYNFIASNAVEKFTINAIDDEEKIISTLNNGEIRFLELNVARSSYRVEIEQKNN